AMTPLSCDEVRTQIDLYAAGECGEPARSAIGRHLTRCPGCARAHEEARQLVGLLDLRFGEPRRLERLRDRIEAEARPRPARLRLLRFPRQVAALAALLLLAVGVLFSASPAEVAPAPGAVQARSALKGAAPPGAREFAPRDLLLPPGPTKLENGATVRFAPGSLGQIEDGRRVKLSAGAVWVRVKHPPARPERTPPFEVQTPAGTVSTEAADLFVAGRPPGP